MILEEDFITRNENDSTNIHTNEEEAIIKTVLTPFIKRMDSSNSIKQNDIYFIKSSSKFSQNFEYENVFDNNNSIGLMGDDFDSSYNDFVNEGNNFSEKPCNNYSSFLGKPMYNTFVQFEIDNDSIIMNNSCIIKGGKEVTKVEETETKGKEDIKVEEKEIKEKNEKETEIKGGEEIIKEETSIETETKENPMKKKSKRGKRGPYKKNKTKLITETDTNDKCFPFIKSKSEANNTQFITNKYITSSDGTQKREKKARKYKPDDIRKKIKVRFHKKIKNIINENLKKAGSNKLFSFLPQLFLGNISKKFNYQYMNKTFEELLSTNFSEFQKKYPNKECDFRQFEKNKETLQYLEENPEISEISGFNVLKKMKYKDILRRYFSSIEFEQSIKQLEKDNEDNEYIQEYICLAKSYIDYFMDVNNSW